MERFSEASGVTRGGETTWSARVFETWDILGNANGGYLLVMAARALCEATGRPDPVSLSGHFLAPGRPGPLTVDVDVVAARKRLATAWARVSDAERTLLTVLGTTGDLGEPDPDAAPLHAGAGPPDLPSPKACLHLGPGELFPPPFMAHVELRLHPDDAGFTRGEPSGTPRMRGWFRLPGDEPLDTWAALLAADSFPPTIFNLPIRLGWTPTVELTAHVRARPLGGWLRCDYRTRWVAAGFLEVDADVWDDAGQLVVQARQLALVPREATASG